MEFNKFCWKELQKKNKDLTQQRGDFFAVNSKKLKSFHIRFYLHEVLRLRWNISVAQ
jgi:hypothetical protein